MFLAPYTNFNFMGEGIAPEIKDKIKLLADQDPAVLSVPNILSTYQSPAQVILMLICVFRPDLDTEDITDPISRVRAAVKAAFPFARFVIILPQIDEQSDQK